MMFTDLQRLPDGRWELLTESSGKLDRVVVTRERLAIHRSDLLEQLALLRECANELGWNEI